MRKTPITLAVYRILSPQNSSPIRIGTTIGIASMLVPIALQMAPVFGVLPFQQGGLRTFLARAGGVGAWLIITGIAAQSENIFFLAREERDCRGLLWPPIVGFLFGL